MRRTRTVPLVAAAALLLAGGLTSCGDDDGPETAGVTMTPTIPSPTGGADTEAEGGAGAEQAVGQLAGTHSVALEVGEMDIELVDGALRLLAVRPASGWEHRVEDEQTDEIDVDFRHGDGREVDVSFDLDDARDFDVSVDYEQGLPEGTQTLTIGAVAELDYEASGTTLTLVDARPGEGWTHTVDDDADQNEIDVELRNGEGEKVDVDIEIDD